MKLRLISYAREIKQNLEVIILLTLVWLIMYERITVVNVLSGILVSILVILFTDRFLLKGNYEYSYMIGLGTLFTYSIAVLIEIFIAGIKIIPSILTGRSDVQIVTLTTKIENELLIVVLANSITLTPGSVTVEKKGNQLMILVLNPPKTDLEKEKIIPERLETILLKYERKTDGNI